MCLGTFIIGRRVCMADEERARDGKVSKRCCSQRSVRSGAWTECESGAADVPCNYVVRFCSIRREVMPQNIKQSH